MSYKLYTKFGVIALIVFSFLSCEDFLDIEAPKHKIVSENVFNDDETAISTMTGIYNELFRSAFSGGWENSVTILSGLSSDNLKPIRANDLSLQEFSEYNIQPNNDRNLSLWSSAYNILYMTNSLLEGVNASENLTEDVRNTLIGEAKVVRAFTNFYLVNLYGNVPLILSTDYRENSLAVRSDSNEIYEQIIVDLTEAEQLLKETYRDNDRTRVNRYTALALLARVHLYQENWEQAEQFSAEVIAQSGTYEIMEDPNQVFLANSQEAIWQISPIGRGGPLAFTNEGSVFLFLSFAPSLTKVSLSENLVESFEVEDLRLLNWIGLNQNTGNYYPYKYKDRSSVGEISEYSMVLRLAEQYLIRAEARAKQENLSDAIADIDVIRKRAGLPLISENNAEVNKEELLLIIMDERRKELFTEWGHRWLDLKRTNRAADFLNPLSDDWENTDVVYPIPAQERMKNPNLNQNPGY